MLSRFVHLRHATNRRVLQHAALTAPQRSAQLQRAHGPPPPAGRQVVHQIERACSDLQQARLSSRTSSISQAALLCTASGMACDALHAAEISKLTEHTSRLAAPEHAADEIFPREAWGLPAP
jgi:hypothetical protein